MSGHEGGEPYDYECCEAVRIGQMNHEEAELTIFYTPNEEFQVHNGYLAETNEGVRLGRSYQRLKIVTPTGKLIFVRRYDDGGDFRISVL